MFHNINLRICEILLSLPSRERGLKYPLIALITCGLFVAPFAGAWIEIRMPWTRLQGRQSLPSRERGLKYLSYTSTYLTRQSLPSRERGLKSVIVDTTAKTELGRSLRGSVDWNSNQYNKCHKYHKSLPSRERGLKWWRIILNSGFLWSLPSWECGLKSVERK